MLPGTLEVKEMIKPLKLLNTDAMIMAKVFLSLNVSENMNH